ncbi:MULTISPECIES: FAD binding domain-containing protein [unclassified Aureimonas]|uniref:FAD binding domain-containing protein n=1 Tax=unclassified Aureimonas TaxID=2615206 RepID=UPI0006FBD3E4|nr:MULTISPECIES: xanthine dehydrogenase family protein subunit M [unclassified Aureimonas]KQT52530.1 molybdopterin dehydrogenase [Aureimonas sp. Leaf427]KQT77569.1 molybdopterin dehydrogenase [Aureimonas sp. Leaf460]
MKSFDYVRPASVAEAVIAAAEPGTAFLAGGTNLLDLMKGGIARPGRLVDITRLPGLSNVDWQADGSVRIGALVRNADLAHDQRFAARFPAVAEALLSGASGQLRNAATASGNLMQETRCRYFYDTASACNRREPGRGCDAIEGINDGHAVLGWSPACIATHPSDFCVPLAALGAIVELEGVSGRRQVPLAQFHRLPGDTPDVRTVCEPGEMIVAVLLPPGAEAFAGHSRYLKVRERTSYAFAVVSAAVGLDLENGSIREARIALGGVAARPWRCEAAEAVLAGATPGRDVFERAAKAALEGAAPSGHNAYKIALAERIVARALGLAAAGTPDRLPALPASPFAPQPKGALHV